MKNRLLILGGIVLLAVSITLAVVLPVEKESEETPPSDTVLVSPLNYVRAETDRNAAIIVESVGLNEWAHSADTGNNGDVPLVRPNFDTVYSSTVLDFSSGKVSVSTGT